MFSSTGLSNPPSVKCGISSQTNVIKWILLGWTKSLIYVAWLHILSNKDNFHHLLDYRLHGLHGSWTLILSCYFTLSYGLSLAKSSFSICHFYTSCIWRKIYFTEYLLWLVFLLFWWQPQNILFFLPTDIFSSNNCNFWY